MNMIPRPTILATVALCAVPFVHTATTAVAAEGRIIGQLFVKGTVKLNGETARSGADVVNGSKLITGKEPARVNLFRGGYVLIKPFSSVRIFEQEGEPIRLDIVFGSGEVRNLDNRAPGEQPPGFGDGPGAGLPDDGELTPLPYTAAFGFGNFSFPSIGGGGSANGPVTSRTLPDGSVGLFDSTGTFIGFQR